MWIKLKSKILGSLTGGGGETEIVCIRDLQSEKQESVDNLSIYISVKLSSADSEESFTEIYTCGFREDIKPDQTKPY